MKEFLRKISVSGNEVKSSLIAQFLSDIKKKQNIQETLEDLAIFFTDEDRSMRQYSFYILENLSEAFDFDPYRKLYLDLAFDKIEDAACLPSCIKMINKYFNMIDDVNKSVNAIVCTNLRSITKNVRMETYLLFEKLIQKGEYVIDATSEFITKKLRSFCGFEHDPACLEIVYRFFPVFIQSFIDKIDDSLVALVFDILGAFYPIITKPVTQRQLCESMVKIPRFADNILSLVSEKLSYSLSDTRKVVMESLDILLVYPCGSANVLDFVVSFAKSLMDYYAKGSVDTPKEVVDKTISRFVEYIRICTDAHDDLKKYATSNWIPLILDSNEQSTCRAYSIITWSLNSFLDFDEFAMIPLSQCLTDSLKNNNERKVQCVLASFVEYLRFLPKEKEVQFSHMESIFESAINVLSRGYSANCELSSLILIRETLSRFQIPYYEELFLSLEKCLKNTLNTSQIFIKIVDQEKYKNDLNTFVQKILDSIYNKTGFGSLENINEVFEYVTSLCKIDFFCGILLPALAKESRFKEILKCIVNIHTLNEDVSCKLLEVLNECQDFSKDLVLAIAIRSKPSVLPEFIRKYNRLSSTIVYATPPSFLPDNLDYTDKLVHFCIGAKLNDYPAGYTPSKLSLAFKGKVDEDFDPNDIQYLLEMENYAENACGEVINRFDLIPQIFIYDPDYKFYLWKFFHHKLNENLPALVHLCLLSPPDFFEAELGYFIPLLPKCIEIIPEKSLDLLFITILKIQPNVMLKFIATMSQIIPLLISLLKSENNRIRLDTCRLLKIIALKIEPSACSAHKQVVVKALGHVLDDPKREIRFEASNAKVNWMYTSSMY